MRSFVVSLLASAIADSGANEEESKIASLLGRSMDCNAFAEALLVQLEARGWRLERVPRTPLDKGRG